MVVTASLGLLQGAISNPNPNPDPNPNPNPNPSQALQGVTSIRAFGRQAAFEATLLRRLDQNHRAHFLWTASNRWFAGRLDVLTASVTLAVGLAVVLFREQLEPSLAALALTYVVQTTSLFQWGFRMWAEVRGPPSSPEVHQRSTPLTRGRAGPGPATLTLGLPR